jgi:methionyl-tRNA formyltransferase
MTAMDTSLNYRRPVPGTGWWYRPRSVSVVVDNPSWVLPFVDRIVMLANRAGDSAVLRHSYDEIPHDNDIAFFLGCVGIARAEILGRSKRNLVVHSSDLPQGRGFAPLAWQIIAGRNDIPTCLIEAAEPVDSGPIVLRDVLHFEGTELYPELRAAQGRMIVNLCLRFLAAPHEIGSKPQVGESTTFRRRTAKDSELDPNKTIAEQFDLLRTVDNAAFPAFFSYRGRWFKFTISPLDTPPR